jgi:LPXTG-site transpeptidase (sortase) family protein
MKKNLIKILFILGIFATLSVLLYPIIADFVNHRSQSRVVSHFIEDMENADDEKKRTVLEAAYEYNRNLLTNSDRFSFTNNDEEEYRKQLDIGFGVMGILTIDKINVNLPIYHGTDEGVLQIGTGHLQGTSLPVGGLGTHAFITGHRGLPSSTLLSNLDKMVKDDRFTLYVLGETLTYQVDEIKIVSPSEVNDLEISMNMDYCTLVTCTPYGINTHRLLVRGYRTENAPDSSGEIIYNDATQIEKIIIIGIFLIWLLPVLLIITLVRCVKIYRKGRFYQ